MNILSEEKYLLERKRYLRWASTATLIGVASCLLSVSSASAATFEDSLVQKTVQVAPNLEPVIPHPRQEEEVLEKLTSLEARIGKKPNILFFIMDVVGWGDPGVYGGGAMVGAPTPIMDLLAREGLQLTSTYSQPTSSPTRATILTGRLPMRHGILRPTTNNEKGGLEGEITLPQILSEAGYVTQAVGKWHIGENLESQPHHVGFDDFYGFLSVSDFYTEWRDPNFNPDIVNSPERTEMVRNFAFEKNWVHAKKGGDLERIAEVDIPTCSILDEKWADYSVEFIKKMATSEKPFFLYHCTRGAHFDNYPNPQFKGKSPGKYPYKDVIIELDYILGRLVKTLEETGQLENTLIFITSDNGSEMEAWPDSAYSPFRGAKGSTWEGGMRVPGIVYWKGMIQPGRVSDGLFDLADLFNTSLTLAGVKDKMPTDRYIDGIDQTSFILPNEGQSNRKYIYYWLTKTFSAIRVGEYKYMMAAESDDDRDNYLQGGFSGETMNYSYCKVFNLYLDPKETHNFFIRKVIYTDVFLEPVKQHLSTFKKYPPKNVLN
ncbi:MAG: arylsulfatase [Candidatus Atribacteria bacterium]|nr:arylsulfatase [Candidatus Atribacteria bacterium]